MDLRDQRARNRIAKRIVLIRGGILGDHKSVGDEIGEFRIDEGSGYRLYLTRRGATILILLCGGDRSSQRRDILSTKALAQAV